MLAHVKSVSPLRLGLLATRRSGVFPAEAAQQQKDLIAARLTELGIDFVDLEGVTESGLIQDGTEADAVVEHFRKEGVDAVFAVLCNFGEELAVGRVCKALGKPVLLWGPRDDAPDADGVRARDTQCGLFAAGKLLRRMGVAFDYVVNCRPDDEVLQRGLDTFLRAANVARSVPGMRIGQLGTRPTPFTSTMANENELLERFGIEIVPVPMPLFMRDALARTQSDEVAEAVAEIGKRVDLSEGTEDERRRLAAYKLALRDWAVDQRLDAMAVHCWADLCDPMGVSGCFVHGEMADLGVPVACETDLNGAVTAVALQAAAMAQTAVFFADLTIRHPENDNAELLWHCGPFPSSLAAHDAQPAVTYHFAREFPAFGVGRFRIQGGEMTIGRFDGDHGEYSFFMAV